MEDHLTEGRYSFARFLLFLLMRSVFFFDITKKVFAVFLSSICVLLASGTDSVSVVLSPISGGGTHGEKKTLLRH